MPNLGSSRRPANLLANCRRVEEMVEEASVGLHVVLDLNEPEALIVKVQVVGRILSAKTNTLFISLICERSHVPDTESTVERRRHKHFLVQSAPSLYQLNAVACAFAARSG